MTIIITEPYHPCHREERSDEAISTQGMRRDILGDCCAPLADDTPWVRPELNLRTQSKRVPRTLRNSISGLSYEPDHSWSGGRDCT